MDASEPLATCRLHEGGFGSGENADYLPTTPSENSV